ncbi:MAG: NADH dehydrogenase [Desulfuromonas sp. SDB]|nr:MAG: NADH dehydrogenase [Desulfuromonas sp. SDB]
MDGYEIILNRRSIRKFTSDKIDQETIEKILNAGMYAPSARNQQPWCFVVTDKRMILDDMPNFHPYAGMMKQATLAILVCADKLLIKSEGYWIQDCSAATQNILLAAYNFGIGSVWLGVYPREERVEGMKKLFSLPDQIIPVSLIALGYPGEEKKQPERFDQSRIHWDRW